MTNPAQKYVFVILHKHKAPSGRELSAELFTTRCDWGRVRNDEIQQNNTVTQAPSTALRSPFLSEEGFKKQAFVHFDKYDKNIVLCQ